MNTQIRLRRPAASAPTFNVGDRVRIAGLSHHCGEVVGIKNNSYSNLTYSVKVGEKRLEGLSPLALTLLC